MQEIRIEFPWWPVLVTLVLVVLKLTNVVAWSWWLVFAPLWGGFLIMLIIFLVLAAIVSS